MITSSNEVTISFLAEMLFSPSGKYCPKRYVRIVFEELRESMDARIVSPLSSWDCELLSNIDIINLRATWQ